MKYTKDKSWRGRGLILYFGRDETEAGVLKKWSLAGLAKLSRLRYS
jgi:hypothetical protein